MLTTEPPALAAARGLLASQKSLPCWLLYDDVGSGLFEAITRLPEYYLTRTERWILQEHAAQMVAAAGPPLTLCELGAGSAAKTRLIVQALIDQQGETTYVPCDVSASALARARRHLGCAFPRLRITPVEARYPDQLDWLAAIPGRRLVLFLGSTLLNFDPTEAGALLLAVRRRLRAGDALLLGADLRKSDRILLPAYDDAQGVTARFNKNVLARLNRELGAAFDLHAFRHVACWNKAASRIEMHLESVAEQAVPIPGVGVARFHPGERLHTESSYKLPARTVHRILGDAGFTAEAVFTDPHGWFQVHLARVQA